MGAVFLTVEEGSLEIWKGRTRNEHCSIEIGGISMHNGFLVYKDIEVCICLCAFPTFVC